MAWTRTERAEYGNPYYNNSSSGISPAYSTCITGYPTVPGLNVLCNCTGLANGAFNETYVMNTGKPAKQYYAFHSNANRFIELAEGFGIETRPASGLPPLGGMVVWGGTANHVAYISAVIDENTITIHQSGWDTPAWEWDIRNVTRNQNGTNMWGYRGTCLGFVVNPGITEEPGPDPADYPPVISSITQTSFTNITISGSVNGVSGITTGGRVYVNYDSSTVSTSNYDNVVTVSGNFNINVNKPREASRVSVLLVQLNNTGTNINSSIQTVTLVASIPCINVYNSNKMKQSIPYVYTGGQWRTCVPYVYTGGQWREIYNNKT